MKPTIPVLIASLLAAGCTTYELSGETEFRMTSDDTFLYESVATFVVPLDDPQAEAARLQFLERSLAANGKCPNGYRITERQVVSLPISIDVGQDPGSKLYYTGECI